MITSDRAHGPEGCYSFDLGTWHIVALTPTSWLDMVMPSWPTR
jgi:hypothetical protein